MYHFVSFPNFPVESNKDPVNQVATNMEELDEEEMLMRAIAMSLGEEEISEEEITSIKIQGPGEL